MTILTGFLGAGNTTLLRRILSDLQGVRFGVLVNDSGAVNIDADLVVEASAGRIALVNGCVCPSIQGDLVVRSEWLDSDLRADRIMIEASGVSRPLPIAAVKASFCSAQDLCPAPWRRAAGRTAEGGLQPLSSCPTSPSGRHRSRSCTDNPG